MKNFGTQGIASLCVAAGSLAVALPAQAVDPVNIFCSESDITTNTMLNPSYRACRGPFGGVLTGAASELTFLLQQFGPLVGGIPFAYRGNSIQTNPDPTVTTDSPFLSNPGTQTGVLAFVAPLSVAFVLGFEGGDNYSYYLFDSRNAFTSSIQFDTFGIADSTGRNPGPPLAFASLYVQQPQGGGAVPEPAGLGLLAAAFGALALASRRRG